MKSDIRCSHCNRKLAECSGLNLSIQADSPAPVIQIMCTNNKCKHINTINIHIVNKTLENSVSLVL